jgi:hypothetical protein
MVDGLGEIGDGGIKVTLRDAGFASSYAVLGQSHARGMMPQISSRTAASPFNLLFLYAVRDEPMRKPLARLCAQAQVVTPPTERLAVLYCRQRDPLFSFMPIDSRKPATITGACRTKELQMFPDRPDLRGIGNLEKNGFVIHWSAAVEAAISHNYPICGSHYGV